MSPKKIALGAAFVVGLGLPRWVVGFLGKGRRYAIVLISSGAHFVATVANNKFAQGTLFYSTDGAFVQGDLFTDLAFETEFALFAAPIVTVQLQALELAGGNVPVPAGSWC